MTAETILHRLRLFLLALVGFLFVGTLVELVFTEHTDKPVQFVPFVLCGVGLFTVGMALVRPQRQSLRALRVWMGIVALGSLLGTYEHIMGNAAFYREVHPDATGLPVVAAALGGADPLVAPGILAVAAVLALAATYYHPALK